MRPAQSVAVAFVLAAVGCASPARPLALTGHFAPTVMYPEGVTEGSVGEYEHTTVRRPDGSPAPFAEAIEVIVPCGKGDPLANSPADSADTGFLDPWHRRPAGTVVERRTANAKGQVSLAFPVGLPACVYAYTDGLAGAGSARAASLITRPENVYGAGLQLVPAAAVAGDVIDDEGRPARGATVRIAFRSPSGTGHLVLMTVCDENGAFALPPIPIGEAGDLVMFRVDADDGRSARVQVTFEDLRTGPMRLALSNSRSR
jgi:hypothetical protein